jgi:hypothetical protein
MSGDGPVSLLLLLLLLSLLLLIAIWIHSIVALRFMHQPKNASKRASMWTQLRVLTKVRITNNIFGLRSESSSLFRVANRNLKQHRYTPQ